MFILGLEIPEDASAIHVGSALKGSAPTDEEAGAPNDEEAVAPNEEEAGAVEVDHKTSRFTEGPSDDRPREKSRKVIQRRRTIIGLREEVKCEYTLTYFEAIIG